MVLTLVDTLFPVQTAASATGSQLEFTLTRESSTVVACLRIGEHGRASNAFAILENLV